MVFRLGIFLTLCLFICLPLVAGAQSESAGVRFNELGLWPAGDDVPWIELYNAGSSAVDVSGWKLMGGGAVLAVLPGTTLAPGEYRVVFDAADQWPASLSSVELRDAHDVVAETAAWTITPDIDASLAWSDSTWQATYLPTAGRPNVILAENICEQETPTPPVAPDPVATSGNVILSEVLPNPEGDETLREFIEIYNADVKPIRLRGWKLLDPAKAFIIGDITLSPQQYWVFYRTESGITLNNDQDSVTLQDAAGHTTANFSYSATAEEKSWNYAAEWYQAAPSPNEVNHAASATQPSPSPSPVPTPEPTPIPAPDPEPAPAEPTSTAIRLSEIYPVPADGQEEWIEIFNPSGQSASLQHLSLTDGVRTYIFGEETLAPGAYLVIPQSISRIQLNNSGDRVMLVLAGNILDETTYETIPPGHSWMRITDGTWQVSDAPNPGAANVAVAPPLEPEQVAPTTASTPPSQVKAALKKAPTAKTISFAEWTKTANKTALQIEGIIGVAPGAIKKRTAFLQPLNGKHSGIEIYFSKTEPQDLDEGDVVLVYGEKSVSSRGDRLLVRAQEDIEVIGAEEISGQPLNLEKPIDQHNQIVTVSGTVTESTSRGLALEQGRHAIEVVYKSFKPENSVEAGNQITISGLYRQDEQKIWVYRDDMIETEAEPMPVTPTEPVFIQATAPPLPKEQKDLNWVYLLGTAGAGGVASWYLSADSAKRALQLVAGFFRKT